MLNFILNILWLVCGGWTVAISWFTSAFLMLISIVGIPWARAAFNIAILTLWPFGSKVQKRKPNDLGTGPLGLVGNILWFVFAGLWLFLVHIFWGLVLAITIIGIPFAVQHFKLAKISLAPIGKEIIW